MFTLFSADFIGNPGNCSYPHKTVVMNTDSIWCRLITCVIPEQIPVLPTGKTPDLPWMQIMAYPARLPSNAKVR